MPYLAALLKKWSEHRYAKRKDEDLAWLRKSRCLVVLLKASRCPWWSKIRS